MLTTANSLPTRFNGGAVTRATFRIVVSGAVPGACSGPTPTGMGAGSRGPGRPTSLTCVYIRNTLIVHNQNKHDCLTTVQMSLGIFYTTYTYL